MNLPVKARTLRCALYARYLGVRSSSFIRVLVRLYERSLYVIRALAVHSHTAFDFRATMYNARRLKGRSIRVPFYSSFKARRSTERYPGYIEWCPRGTTYANKDQSPEVPGMANRKMILTT